MIKRIGAAALAAALLFTATGCAARAVPNSVDNDSLRSAESTPMTDPVDMEPEARAAIAGFAVELFKRSAVDNVLVSPMSVLSALAMTANGAQGETLSQMEGVLGMSRDELNAYIREYMTALPEAEKYKLSLVNSIWIRDSFAPSVSMDFIKTSTGFFDASTHEAPFDATTLEDINSWVNDKTDGMIDSILDEIPADAIMYLINALAFDAEWEDIYSSDQIRDGVFTTEAGLELDAMLMYHTEHSYLADDLATGFIKYYADRKYAFAAMLPNVGVSLSDYVASLDGEALLATLDGASTCEIRTAIPKFECDYSVTLNDCLAAMGMPDAFDPALADFSGITDMDNDLFISRILHKTFISVDERGTKAGAVTAVEMRETGIMLPDQDVKTVYLDRPFVYMLIDCETSLPLFIGTVNDVSR